MFKFNPPLKPTLKRYWKIFFMQNNISIQRALMYEALDNIEISGRILDFGGGKNANYSNLLNGWIKNGTYESANISKNINPTYLLDKSGNIPLPDQTFDVVLSLNTFEHIFEIDKNIRELKRVLKKGGIFLFSTPFLYRVHASPDDFIRPTYSWWGKVLNDLQMSDIEIIPLVWDPFTSAFSICDGILPFSSFFKRIIAIYGLIYSLLKGKKGNKYYPKSVGEKVSNFALGYVIIAKKD